MHFLIVQRLLQASYDVGGRAEIRFAEFQMDDGTPLLLQLVQCLPDWCPAGINLLHQQRFTEKCIGAVFTIDDLLFNCLVCQFF